MRRLIPFCLMVLLPQLILAEGVTQTQTIGITCTSSGQLCEPPHVLDVATDGVLRTRYVVTTHCSSVRVRFFLDSTLVYTSEFLGWSDNPEFGPLETGFVDLGPVSAGTHRLEVQAEGTVSGCNVGFLQRWEGTFEVVTSMGPQECVPEPDGLVAWWTGDGTAEDLASGNDGVLTNGATFAPGKVGDAFLLDGVNDFVAIGDPAELEPPAMQSFTFMAWVKRNGPHGGPYPNFQVIVGRAPLVGNGTPEYYLRWKDGAANFVTVTGGVVNDLPGTIPLADGVWYHIAGTFDDASGVKNLYVNGVLDISHAVPGSIGATDTVPWRIGHSSLPGVEEPFNGRIDEVQVFDRALSTSEIQTIVNAGSAGICKTDCTDLDSDGYGFPGDPSCPMGGEDDCDDASRITFPGAPELFDGLDNNCDGVADDGLDDDSDGIPNFNDACAATPVGSGVGPDGCAVCHPDPDSDGDGFPASMDCNDGDPSINPNATESCNGIDDDCDTVIDEGFDADGDGFTSCDTEGNPADCNDGDFAINPNAIELPGNATDENCDGSLGACDPNATWNNHGEYVRCVSQEVEALVAAGVLTQDAGDALVQNAAQSDVGKKP